MSEDSSRVTASDQEEEREARLDKLRKTLTEGEGSGMAEPFDFKAFLSRR